MASIEEEIKQRTFRNLRHKSLVNIIFTGNWVTALHSRFLKEFGISEQQFNILRILRGQHPKPASIVLLKERMLDKMSDVSRLVERLRTVGLLERTPNATDRRAVDVRITEQGLALLHAIDQRSEEVDAMIHTLSDEELLQLNHLLDKIRSQP